MCDTAPNHNTGWKIVRIKRGTNLNGYEITWLYLRCRTKNCIETKVVRREGWYYEKDFTNCVLD